MSENEINETTSVERTEAEVATSVKSSKKSMLKVYLLAIIAVLIILSGVIFMLEKEGRSSTNVFSTVIEKIEENKVVAVVNGEEITNAELKVSMEQFAQMAAAQGVDLANEEAQSEIRSQSLEVLINTELLRQAAIESGINISDEDVQVRLDSIVEQLGGDDALTKRMEELGIEQDKLVEDIRTEITIQTYLDQVFAEQPIEITQEEIEAVYSTAGGENAGLPSLEEVEEQVRASITASKEQEIVDSLLEEVKIDADIEIIE